MRSAQSQREENESGETESPTSTTPTPSVFLPLQQRMPSSDPRRFQGKGRMGLPFVICKEKLVIQVSAQDI